MCPDFTMTDAEREKLDAVWDEAPIAGDHREVVALVTAALAAVPRLALASPMVGAVRSQEAEAMAGMPEIRGGGWGVMSATNDAIWASSRARALQVAREMDRLKPHLAPWRAVRFGVVEIPEPEPPRPVREVGPSGYEYRWTMGCLEQWRDGVLWYSFLSSADVAVIPHADRPLVARLLGEVAS